MHLDRMEVEEVEMSVDVNDVWAFTADVNRQVVYWVDSVSWKMWSSKLNDTDPSLVGRFVNHLESRGSYSITSNNMRWYTGR